MTRHLGTMSFTVKKWERRLEEKFLLLEQKLKKQWSNDQIKPLLEVKGIKLWKFVSNPIKINKTVINVTSVKGRLKSWRAVLNPIYRIKIKKTLFEWQSQLHSSIFVLNFLFFISSTTQLATWNLHLFICIHCFVIIFHTLTMCEMQRNASLTNSFIIQWLCSVFYAGH